MAVVKTANNTVNAVNPVNFFFAEMMPVLFLLLDEKNF